MSDSEDSDTAIVARNRRTNLFRAPSSSPVKAPAAAAAAPARRALPRFLGDGDSPTKDNDLDDLFSGLDDIPNAPSAIPKRLNANRLDALLNASGGSGSGSGASNAGGGDAGTNVWDDAGVVEDGVVQKKRRVVAKMDEARLLGDSGFPRLLQDVTKFKLKGKGHEAQDLKRLMSMYQLWAHQMYPKTNLRDTLKTVEKLCHKRSVQRSLRQYRDDFKHGSSAKPSTSSHTNDLSLSDENEPQLRPYGAPSSSSSRPPASKPTEARPNIVLGDEDFDDMFADEDDILAALDMEAASGGGSSAPAPRAAARREQEDADEDEDEAMLALAEAEAGGAGGWDEDEEAERAMREMEGM